MKSFKIQFRPAVSLCVPAPATKGYQMPLPHFHKCFINLHSHENEKLRDRGWLPFAVPRAMRALPDPSACAGLLCAASACRGCQSRPRGPCSSCNVSSQLVSFTPSLIQTWLWMALGNSSPEEGSPWVWTRRKGLPKCLEVPHHKERAGAAFSNDKSMSPSRKAQMKFGYSLSDVWGSYE